MAVISGVVDRGSLEARLEIASPKHRRAKVVVDTGFTGQLSLPRSLLRRLGFRYLTTTEVELALGNWEETKVYRGEILWFGQRKEVEALLTGSRDGLLGMEMLKGCVLEVDLVRYRVKIIRR